MYLYWLPLCFLKEHGILQDNIYKASDLAFIDQAPDDHNFEFYVYIVFLLAGGKFRDFLRLSKKGYLALRLGKGALLAK